MTWLAHSAKRDRPAQTYQGHVGNVLIEAKSAAADAALGLPLAESFFEMVVLAAEFHDLGKLDDDNQCVLAAPTGKPLPHDHVDAGVKYLFTLRTHAASYAGMLAYSHHRGLPDLPAQEARPRPEQWRGNESNSRFPVAEIIVRTATHLSEYLVRHQDALQASLPGLSANKFKPDPMDLRMALSCLADADHGDTARHYGDPFAKAPILKAAERLTALSTYVSELPCSEGASERERERVETRRELYFACMSADTGPSIYACDSPVGSGKTTAVMAHLLRAATDKGLRRIFVVLPFTNIIDQSVKVYRDSLVLDGELDKQVVAAHHHKSDFADPLTRELTTRWHTPVVVTTAVQFFETLASNRPADLRKLHRVARSAIFIDEAHAALPAHLWPLAWKWLRHLAKQWGCHIVLGSGSLAKFWTLHDFYEKKLVAGQEITEETVSLPALADAEVEARLASLESRRVNYRKHPTPLNLDALIDFISELPGPRLVVLNTVQTAAVVAQELARSRGRIEVEHLSTALTPADRLNTLTRVLERLDNKDDKDWTLVATSMVEAGVNLSFRTGVRELSSLSSLLQLSGRVNRHGENESAEVWSVKLQPGGALRKNLRMDIPAGILTDLYVRNHVAAAYCTNALRREVREQSNHGLIASLFQAERAKAYPAVADNFKVIDSETITTLVPGPALDLIRQGQRPDWNTLQMHCVQIWANRKLDFALTEIPAYPGLFAWNLDYDDFIGYMRGAIKSDQVKSGLVQIV
ncbi:MAG: DEAD/DEAH box helicase family protein [Sulfuritalea sp.]|nr:DEAD/DEAH box helicase family protein [Sulfuritalea sp.]MDP1983150.1 DEAD/DEAH box helicase family protein [Sulfuritalea sp.]